MYRVLLVEDDASMTLFYECMRTWQDYGFQIAQKVTHGAEALRVLEKESFDLIFTDISMPIMTGVELLKNIRKNGCTTPVIFSSSYSDFEYAQKGILYDLFDYIVKPIDDKKLSKSLARLKKLLDEKNEAKADKVVSALLCELGLDADADDFVKKIAVYCSENYKNDLTGDVLADEFGYNKNYFGTVFKQHFGMTHREFVTRVKIAYAIELMRVGTYKAYEISEILGFSTYKYFNEKFKEVTGVSPTDYKYGSKGKKQNAQEETV